MQYGMMLYENRYRACALIAFRNMFVQKATDVNGTVFEAHQTLFI